MSDFAQSVKEQTDIVKIVESYIRLRKAGAQNYSGLCPFHKEKSPSFSVHAVRQFFHCFGCGVSGDVFTFVGKIENVTFPEAVRIVAQKVGIPLPKREFSSPEQAAEARLRIKLLELHETAAAWFEEQLRSPEGALAREYLAGRGLDANGIKTFRIGYAPDSFNALRDRLSSLADAETLRASGLFSAKEQGIGPDGQPQFGPLYDRFRKRILFPIANESGRVIAFTGRILAASGDGEKAGPKYLNSPETPLYSKGHVLFNLDKAKTAIRQMEFALLVEGQMDCISVYLRGFQNVIATSGTAFTEQQVALLRRHTSQIAVNFDPDAAGANAAEKSIALLTEEGFAIKIVTLEDGLDPDRYIRERGVEAYKQAIRGARRQADYLIERARQMFPGPSAEQKVKAMNYLLPHIRRMPNELIRVQFADDAAQKLGIDSAVLKKELHQAALKRRDQMTPPNSGGLLPFERFFIEATCNDHSSASEYEHVHEELRAFDQRMKETLASPNWQAYVLTNLPVGLFEQLVARRQGSDVESTASTEEQRTFLRKVFLESGTHPRVNRQDLAIVKDLEVEALKWSITTKRSSLDMVRRDGDMAAGIRLSQEILDLEKYLRTIEDEEGL